MGRRCCAWPGRGIEAALVAGLAGGPNPDLRRRLSGHDRLLCGGDRNGTADAQGRAAEGAHSGRRLSAGRYPRIKPSISSDAQAIARSMLSPCCVQRAIILVIVACEYICVAIFVGAGAQAIEVMRSSRGG